jgi:hypothetical protein
VQEAWEEAGLVGDLDPDPIGTYVQEKSGQVRLVTVFRMRVTQVLDDWPEREMRRRAWLWPAEALWRIDLPPLRNLVREVILSEMKPLEQVGT